MFVNTNKPLYVSVLFIRPSSRARCSALCHYYNVFRWFASLNICMVFGCMCISSICMCAWCSCQWKVCLWTCLEQFSL